MSCFGQTHRRDVDSHINIKLIHCSVVYASLCILLGADGTAIIRVAIGGKDCEAAASQRHVQTGITTRHVSRVMQTGAGVTDIDADATAIVHAAAVRSLSVMHENLAHSCTCAITGAAACNVCLAGFDYERPHEAILKFCCRNCR